MNTRDTKNKDIKSRVQQPRLRSVSPRVSEPRMRSSLADNYYKNSSKPQIISGYFIEDKSYKEIQISKANSVLACVIGVLVFASIISYYFVITCELELNKIRKETLVLNEENAELQVELYKKKSYDNIEKMVTKSNNLGRANAVLKVPIRNSIKRSELRYSPEDTTWQLGF